MPVPDRWLNYTNIGRPIRGTCFLPLKVPLKQGICNNLKESQRFTPDMLVQDQPKLGMVIDLTFTTKYYHPQEIIKHGRSHLRIPTRGHQKPGKVPMSKFFAAVDSFVKKQMKRGSDDYIGVHCTHGVNRTGYAICAYMIQRLGYTPYKAIKRFNQGRGHKIERENYLAALNLMTPFVSEVFEINKEKKALKKSLK